MSHHRLRVCIYSPHTQQTVKQDQSYKVYSNKYFVQTTLSTHTHTHNTPVQ